MARVFAIAGEGRDLYKQSLDGETFTVPVFADPDDPLPEPSSSHTVTRAFLFSDGEGKACIARQSESGRRTN